MIASELKDHILERAVDNGFVREVEITRQSPYMKMNVHLRRLVELCLERGDWSWDPKTLLLLEPQYIAKTQFGDLYVGRRKGNPPHITWKNLAILTEDYTQEQIVPALKLILYFDGEYLTEKDSKNHLKSCEDMLELLCEGKIARRKSGRDDRK